MLHEFALQNTFPCFTPFVKINESRAWYWKNQVNTVQKRILSQILIPKFGCPQPEQKYLTDNCEKLSVMQGPRAADHSSPSGVNNAVVILSLWYSFVSRGLLAIRTSPNNRNRQTALHKQGIPVLSCIAVLPDTRVLVQILTHCL